MRKVSSFTSLLLLFSILSLPLASAATAKAGGACTKAGATSMVAGVKLTCAKSGQKLPWKKAGIAPAPSATPTPTKTAAPFVAPKPITLPVAQKGSITFANAIDHIAEIPMTAWQKVQDLIASNPTPTKPIANEVHVGPNTQIIITGGLPRIQELLLRNQKLWSGFTQVSTFHLLMYNAKDEQWAEEDWKKTGADKKYFAGAINAEVTRIAGNCQKTLAPGVFSGPPDNCSGADSTAIENTNDAILTFGFEDGTRTGPFVTSGGILGHEYAHAVQAAQWIGKPSSYCTEQTNSQYCNRSWNSNWGFSPCWLFEGLPNSVGQMTAFETYALYKESRQNLPYGQGPTTVTDYSQASLLSYLVNQSHSTCYANGDLYRLGYTVGALAVETLTAIAGPQSVMALYSLGAEGQKFETAFQNVYGISWSEASVILSKVLAAEYATFGTPPK